MDCVAAMTASFCPTWRVRRRGGLAGGKEGPFFRYGLCNKVSLLRVRASAGGEGGGVGVAVKEGFADEEDFMKGGGPELLLVQMQQKKVMEKQSKLADKVFNIHTLSLSFHGFYLYSYFGKYARIYSITNFK